jgi:hypothetical protein
MNEEYFRKYQLNKVSNQVKAMMKCCSRRIILYKREYMGQSTFYFDERDSAIQMLHYLKLNENLSTSPG